MVDIVLSTGAVIPERELSWRFDTSGGPGGQHANRAATRAEVSFDFANSDALDDRTKQRLADGLGARARDGVVTVAAGESRSQWNNRAAARRRLSDLLDEALRPRRRRRATRPTRGSRARRLETKRQRSETKRLRRRPEADS
jgi:ribosome-associated protein